MAPTPEPPAEGLRQHLVSILIADVAGYTRLMGVDERSTIQALDAARAIFRTEVEAHGGRVIDMTGDSILTVFEAASAAVTSAVAVQKDLRERFADQPEDRRMRFRIGVHLGDVMSKDDGTVYGDGVNVAARLESLAPPGGVAVSRPVRATVGDRCGVEFVDVGEQTVKNVSAPVGVFLVDDGGNLELEGGAHQQALAQVGNVPVQPSTLIGRREAVEDVTGLLQSSRLVTLLGMGGIGKTRLSIEVAHRSASRFPDGVWFVDFAAVTQSDAVGLAVAGVFGVTQQGGKSIEESLSDALGSRRLLLLFDNCEHVTEAAASLSHGLLSSCPQVQILATSREALSIDGEHVWQVPVLAVEGESAPAVQLFVERARAVAPGFELGDQAGVVGQICQELDGIPLAIELAAARVRSLGPDQILARLSKRFRLLTGGSRGVRERHQTLRNAVQWSFDYLSDEERQVVSRAAVFAGGFTLEAAEQVCAGDAVDEFDICDLLDSLVSKSLIQVERSGGSIRYRLLETIRSFGEESLEEAELEATRSEHAKFFAEQSDEYFKVWRSPREREAYEWLDAEIHNLRVAFHWALQHDDVDVAARIASDVGDMGRFRLREEAANWAEQIVDRARETRHPRLAILITWCASTAWAFSRFDDAKRFGEEAIALRDDKDFDPFVWAYGDLAFVSIFSGDIPGAIDLLQRGAEHPADSLDRFMMAFHLFIMATAGFAEQAAHIADEVVQKVDAAGVPMAVSIAHGARAAALEATDPAEALREYEHAIDVARNGGARFMEALLAPRLAALHARGGEPEVALKSFQRMMETFGEATDIASVSASRACLVVILTKLGRYESAATLHGTFAGVIDAAGVVPELPSAVEELHSKLGQEAFDAAELRGGGMSLREASNYAAEQVRSAIYDRSQQASG